MEKAEHRNVELRLSWLVSIVLACCLGSATSAHAGWSSPITLARSAYAGPAIAGSTRHGAAVGWVGAKPIVMRVRRLGPTGRLGRVRSISDVLDDSPTPRIGVASSGAAVMVWVVRREADSAYALLARRISARGKIGRLLTLAHDRNISGEGLDEQLVVDAAGNATVVWHRELGDPVEPKGFHVTESTLHMRRLNADGSLGPVADIAPEGGFDHFPRLAAEPSGRVALVWVRRASDLYSVRARLIRRDGRLGPLREVSAPSPHWPGASANVALDAKGRATITWATSSPSTVVARQLSDQGLGPTHILAPPGSYYGPHVTVDKRGTATVAWRELEPGPAFGSSAKARQIRRDGSAGLTRTLSTTSGQISEPQLVADGLGRTTVVWVQSASPFGQAEFVRSRAFAPDGRLGAAHTVGGGSAFSLIGGQQVVADARGRVTAAWYENNGTLPSIRAARWVPRRR
jgi:hypothetical protein